MVVHVVDGAVAVVVLGLVEDLEVLVVDCVVAAWPALEWVII